jgi:hypothetical protein
MTRQLFTIIIILAIQIAGLITFDLLDWDYLYDIVKFGCPASLIMLGILNVVSDDIMNWFSKPVFRKNNYDYSVEDYYNEFVKDYDKELKTNTYYNKLFFDKLWLLAKDGLSLTKVLGFINSFDNDENHINETSKETFERFTEYWKKEFDDIDK